MKSRILIVEDNPTNQMIMEAMLRQIGMESVVAPSLKEARCQLATAKFSLILMDTELPDGDGVTFTREYVGNGGEIPVVSVTGAGWRKNHRAHCEKAGMVAYLEKPFTLKQLAKLVNHCKLPEK